MSECVGVSRVGFMIIVLGLTSAIMSAILNRLVKYVPRFIFVIAAGLINCGLVIFLLLWKRMPSYILVFLFPVGWGTADAIWNIIPSSTYDVVLVCMYMCVSWCSARWDNGVTGMSEQAAAACI